MEKRPQVAFLGMSPSLSLAGAIRRKLRNLEQICHVLSARVTIEQAHKHSQQGRPFDVRINLATPGRHFSIGRVQGEYAYLALYHAFNDLRRQIAASQEKARDGCCRDRRERRDGSNATTDETTP